jgi:hypothetical protein
MIGPTGASVWNYVGIGNPNSQAGSIYYIGGNVGIGNSTPKFPLDIVGNTCITGDLLINGNIKTGFPNTTTYSTLPTFNNKQIGNIISTTIVGPIFETDSIVSFGNIILPTGVWLMNWGVVLNVTTEGNVNYMQFGITTLNQPNPPSNALYVSSASQIYGVNSPAIAINGSYVVSNINDSQQYYLNGNISFTGLALELNTKSFLTATRLG